MYLPRVALSAEDVERRAGLPPGWVLRHSGVEVRYECVMPETLATMAQEAVRLALEDAGIGFPEIDLIVDCSTCRHQPIPCNAAILQAIFGSEAHGIPCMDVQGACLGFVLGLNVANGLLAAGGYERILLVCSEAGLPGVNWDEPESATLMGDGAAAVIVERAEPRADYYFRHETYSAHVEDCEVRGGGHRLPAYLFKEENVADYLFHMDGPQVFRTALLRLPQMFECLIEEASTDRASLLVVPHQASPRAVESVRRVLKLTSNQFVNRVAKMGNMIAASIPAMLHEVRQEGRLHPGQPVMLLGTSAGYAQAGLIFTP
jgi:3-oxoacyl-[acyl-carrier-protein] synthase-3